MYWAIVGVAGVGDYKTSTVIGLFISLSVYIFLGKRNKEKYGQEEEKIRYYVFFSRKGKGKYEEKKSFAKTGDCNYFEGKKRKVLKILHLKKQGEIWLRSI